MACPGILRGAAAGRSRPRAPWLTVGEGTPDPGEQHPGLRQWLQVFTLIGDSGICGWLIGSGRFGGTLPRNIRMLTR